MKRSLYALAAVLLLTPAAAFAADDAAEFAKKAAHGNNLEVELGELATEQAASDAVKQFGERMVQDHSNAQEQLEQAAEQANVELPSGLDEKGKETRAELSEKSGAEFDRAYMEEMVKDHDKDVKLYEKHAQGDGPIQQYAADTVPTLRAHLDMAKDVKQQVE